MKKTLIIFVVSLLILGGCGASKVEEKSMETETNTNTDLSAEYEGYTSKAAGNADFESKYVAGDAEGEVENFYDTVDKIEYSKILDEEGTNLFYFYQETCGYCNKLKPLIISFVEELQGNEDIHLYFVDAAVEEDVWGEPDYVAPVGEELSSYEEIKIKGTPTMAYVKDGALENLNVGGQEIDALVTTIESEYNL